MGSTSKWDQPDPDTVKVDANATPVVPLKPGQPQPTGEQGWDGVGPAPQPLDIYGGPPHEDWGDTETMTPEELQQAIILTRAFDPPGVDTPNELGLADDFVPGRPYIDEPGGQTNDGQTKPGVPTNPKA